MTPYQSNFLHLNFKNVFNSGEVKVKYTFVQALRLCAGRTAHRGSRGIALLFLDHGTRGGWGVSVTPQPLFTPGKDPLPIVREAGWAPGLVWTCAENFAPTGIRSPDRPARSQSLYRLSYQAHLQLRYSNQKNFLTVTLRVAGRLLIWASKTTKDQIYFVWILGLFTSGILWNTNFSVPADKWGLMLPLESTETRHPIRYNLFNLTFKYIKSICHLTEYDLISDRSTTTTTDPCPLF